MEGFIPVSFGKPIDLRGESAETVQSFIDKLTKVCVPLIKTDDRLRCGVSSSFCNKGLLTMIGGAVGCRDRFKFQSYAANLKLQRC
jgi:hypothetical protein